MFTIIYQKWTSLVFIQIYECVLLEIGYSILLVGRRPFGLGSFHGKMLLVTNPTGI